jgi:hypothetical protein
VRPSVEAESPAVVRVLPLLLLIALAGCGGGGDDDQDEVRQTVRDFVEATNQRDGETLCGELLTQEYMEKSTLAEGDQAGEECRQQIDRTVDLELRLVSVGKTEVDGDDATVRVVIDTGGVQAPRLFRLEREDDRWKLADGTEG